MSRLAVVIWSVATALCLGLESAQACTCARGNVRDTLSRADAAFIGTLVERRRGPQPPPIGPAQPIGPDIFTFRVDDVVKGRLGKSVEVWSSSTGASCGLEIGVGERIGLFLSREGDRWNSNLCWQVSPTALREAERQLPQPNGSGPVRFLVGGGFGDTRLLALDARGRTLGYGFGRGATKLLSICPRGGRAVEIVDAQPERVAVRDIRTLSVVREVPLPSGSVAANVHCRDAAARDVYVFATRQQNAPSVVFHMRTGEIRERYVGSAQSSVFRRDAVYLTEGAGGREVVRVDLPTGARRSITTSRFGMNHLAVSPQGVRIAGIHSEDVVPPVRDRLVLLRLDRSAPARSIALANPWFRGELTWLDESRLAVFPHGGNGLVYDRSLRRLGRLKRWWAADAVVLSGVAYGVVPPVTPAGEAWLQTATLPNGVARRVRGFPGAGAAVIVSVPGRIFVQRLLRQTFCTAAERVFS